MHALLLRRWADVPPDVREQIERANSDGRVAFVAGKGGRAPPPCEGGWVGQGGGVREGVGQGASALSFRPLTRPRRSSR